MAKRSNLLCFVANDDEKGAIKDNANERSMSMSAFVRSRSVKPEMTNNELANMLMGFMSKIVEIRPSYKEAKRILKPPPAAQDIRIEEMGMSKEQKRIFRKAERGRMEARGELMNELKECLKEKGLEQCNIDILSEKQVS